MGTRTAELNGWLALHCQLVGGVDAALATVGGDAAVWPSADRLTGELRAIVALAAERGTPVVREPHAEAPLPTVHIAIPVIREGVTLGAFGVSVRDQPRDRLKALVDLLGWCGRGLERLLAVSDHRDLLEDRLSLADALLDRGALDEAAHALASGLAHRLACERVSIGLRRGKRMRLQALSTSLRFAEESDAVRDLSAAMNEAADQDQAIESPAPPGAPPGVALAHDRALEAFAAQRLRTVPLISRGRIIGALSCEWSEANPLDDLRRRTHDESAALCGPILELMAQVEAGPIERTRGWFARLGERYLGADRGLLKWGLVGVSVVVLILGVAPANYRIAARASLEGRTQRALVAAVDGYLAEAHVRAGDIVQQGDVLARLDDGDLRLEHRKWQSQKAQLDKEYREALAGEDRTRVSLLRAQLEQISAELGLADEQLRRTTVVAPFDGVVLEGDLDHSLGSPVDRGSVLFEMAPLDGYRVIVQIDERDIGDVAVGQRGRLALSALPGRALPLRVERIIPMSTPEDGRNYFRVEAVFEEAVEGLRPGMEGVAKIEAGRRRLLWIWTHGMFDWLRLRTWSFLP